jgi:hypothetical protein
MCCALCALSSLHLSAWISAILSSAGNTSLQSAKMGYNMSITDRHEEQLGEHSSVDEKEKRVHFRLSAKVVTTKDKVTTSKLPPADQ